MTNAGTSTDNPYESNIFDDAPDTEIVAPRAGVFGNAQNRLFEVAEDGKAELVRSFDGLVMLAHEIAARVESVGGSPVSALVRQAAGVIEGWQGTLRDRPVEHLLDDGRDFIRHSPRVAIGVAVIAGFVAARLIKSASDES